MKSTTAGSLSPVWQSISGNSTREQQNPIITSQLLANWSSPDIEIDTPCGYPGKKATCTSNFMGTRPVRSLLPRCPILGCTHSHSHTTWIVSTKHNKRGCEARPAASAVARWCTLVPLMGLILRLMICYAVVRCLAVQRTPLFLGLFL